MVLGSQKSSGTNTGGYTPLVDTPPAGGGYTPPAAPPAAPYQPPLKPFVDWSEKPGLTTPGLNTPGLTGLTIVNVTPPENYAAATAASTSVSKPAPAVYVSPTQSVTAPKTAATFTFGTVKSPGVISSPSQWNWYTPGGTITSRNPTESESESGLGCPEVPDIWTYPGQSQQDLRYCQNMLCPSNRDPSEYDQTIEPGAVPSTPAVLQDQGQDSPAGKRWFCGVCRTYQG